MAANSSPSPGPAISSSSNTTTTAIDPSLSRIYVAPTTKSLAAFQTLCSNNYIRTCITEVIFLGKVHENDSTYSLDQYKACLEEAIGKGWVGLPDDFVIDDEAYEESYPLYQQLTEAHLFEAKETYDVLIDVLPRLPSLRKVGVQTKIDEPGLNEDRCSFSDEYMEVNGVVPYSQSADGGERLAYRAFVLGLVTNPRRWAAVDVFLEALGNAPNHCITHLALGNGVDDQLGHDILGRFRPKKILRAMHAIAKNLIHLNLSIKDDISVMTYPADKEEQWRAFLPKATKLRVLLIHPDPGQEWPCDLQECSSILGIVLCHQTYQKLRTFRVVGELDQPVRIRAVWLSAFLARHAATMRHLSICGGIFVNWYEERAIRTAMFNALCQMRKRLKLRSAEILLQRPEERKYKSYQEPDMAELDGLAKSVDVAAEDGLWDFGEFVMRA